MNFSADRSITYHWPCCYHHKQPRSYCVDWSLVDLAYFFSNLFCDKSYSSVNMILSISDNIIFFTAKFFTRSMLVWTVNRLIPSGKYLLLQITSFLLLFVRKFFLASILFFNWGVLTGGLFSLFILLTGLTSSSLKGWVNISVCQHHAMHSMCHMEYSFSCCQVHVSSN